MTVQSAPKAPTATQIANHMHDDLKRTYLTVYNIGTVDAGDIVDQVHVNSRYARELLGVLAHHNLILNPDENDTSVYTYNTDPFDDKADNEVSAEEVFDQWAKEHNLTPVAPHTPSTATNTANTTSATPRQPQDRKSKKGTGSCTCGCGRSTGSLYAPGHDAKHAGEVARRLAERWIAEGEPTMNGHDDEIIKVLPSMVLADKALRIARGLFAKASTKGTGARHATEAAIEAAIAAGEAARAAETRSPEDDAEYPQGEDAAPGSDSPAGSYAAVAHLVEPHYTYGVVKVGRQVFLARRDNDGVIMRNNVGMKSAADAADHTSVAATLDYDGTVEGKPAQTFKPLAVQP